MNIITCEDYIITGNNIGDYLIQYNIDYIDIMILKSIPSSLTYVPVLLLDLTRFCDEKSLCKRLEELEMRGLIYQVGLSGTVAYGMTLSNGIHHIGLTGRAKHYLRCYKSEE